MTDRGANAANPGGWSEPNTVVLALAGAVITAFAAGPVTFLIFGIGFLSVDGHAPFGFSVDLVHLIEGVLNVSMAGPVGGAPAAIINTLTLGWLARHGRDRLGFAVASGFALGTVIGIIACFLFASMGETEATFRIERLIPNLPAALAFIGAGGLMGALHWRIAIRPRRRWRVFQEQERIALRVME